MSILGQLGAGPTTVLSAGVGALVAYAAVVLLTRLAGPRSLATMSSYDFAATVAVGSTVSSAATGSVPLVSAVLALLLLYALQYVIAALRRRGRLGGLVDNSPLLLLADGTVLTDNLRRARVSTEELRAQIRLAGMTRLDQVRAVILETTGDMSVLGGDEPIDRWLLEGVRRPDASA